MVLVVKGSQWCGLELTLVQILVVVANTQVRHLRTDEEKGSM